MAATQIDRFTSVSPSRAQNRVILSYQGPRGEGKIHIPLDELARLLPILLSICRSQGGQDMEGPAAGFG